MKNSLHGTAFYWIAAVLATAALLIIALFSGLFGGSEPAMDFSNRDEALTFAFWPVIYCLGLLLAFRWRIPGAVLSLVGLLVLFARRLDLLGNLFFLSMLIPPAFFILAAKFTGKKA